MPIQNKVAINTAEAIPFAIQDIIQLTNKPILFIANNNKSMWKMHRNLNFILPNTYNIISIPELDLDFCEKSTPNSTLSQQRIHGLAKLCTTNNTQSIVITTAKSILYKTITPTQLQNNIISISKNIKCDIIDIKNKLVDIGYQINDIAQTIGEISHTGEIINIVQNENLGHRIIFNEDHTESIKTFLPATQISNKEITQIDIVPHSEIIRNTSNIMHFIQEYKNNNLDTSSKHFSAIQNNHAYGPYFGYLPLFYKSTSTIPGYMEYLYSDQYISIITDQTNENIVQEIKKMHKLYNHANNIEPNTTLELNKCYTSNIKELANITNASNTYHLTICDT